MKKKLKFPIVKGKKDHWPLKAVCPICGKGKVLEPHSMAILSAGAMLVDRKQKTGRPSDTMDGFMSLMWHGAHDRGKGKYREIGCGVNIMFDVMGGQADLYFCSTKCLRRFFDKCVDELEGRMDEEMKQFQPSVPPNRRSPSAPVVGGR